MRTTGRMVLLWTRLEPDHRVTHQRTDKLLSRSAFIHHPDPEAEQPRSRWQGDEELSRTGLWAWKWGDAQLLHQICQHGSGHVAARFCCAQLLMLLHYLCFFTQAGVHGCCGVERLQRRCWGQLMRGLAELLAECCESVMCVCECVGSYTSRSGSLELSSASQRPIAFRHGCPEEADLSRCGEDDDGVIQRSAVSSSGATGIQEGGGAWTRLRIYYSYTYSHLLVQVTPENWCQLADYSGFGFQSRDCGGQSWSCSFISAGHVVIFHVKWSRKSAEIHLWWKIKTQRASASQEQQRITILEQEK